MSCDAQNQSKTSVDIQCLPTDILIKICALFCDHCTNTLSDEEFGSRHLDIGLRYLEIETPARVTLRSLTEVSKRFRSVCLPFLVHQMGYDQFHKFLEFQNGYLPIQQNRREILITFECPRLKSRESPELASSSSSPPCAPFRDVPDTPNYTPRFEAAFRHFSTFVLENLQSITIMGSVISETLSAWNLLNSILKSAPALRILRLKELKFCDAEGDTIGFTSKKKKEDNKFVSLSSHKNLRCLMISFGWYGTAEHEFLKIMLLAFERLNRLSILGKIIPSGIAEAISLRKDTLRVLELKDWYCAIGYDRLSSLVLFTSTALKKLIMTDNVFQPYDEMHDNDINETYDRRLLVEMIPVSVQELTLLAARYESNTEKTAIGLVELGRDISRGRFPNLKHVIIEVDFYTTFVFSCEWKKVNDDEDGVEFQRFIDSYRKGVKATRRSFNPTRRKAKRLQKTQWTDT